MKNGSRKFDMGGLLALLLFAVFAVCVLSVLLMGANTYKRLAYSNSAEDTGITAVQYISTKVRQADSEDALAVGTFEAESADRTGDTLILKQEYDDMAYTTRIYCHEGYIYELFGFADGEYDRGSGEKILEASSLQFAIDESGMLHVGLVDPDGKSRSIDLAVRSGRVVSE